MEFLHRIKLIHTDLKPENVLAVGGWVGGWVGGCGIPLHLARCPPPRPPPGPALDPPSNPSPGPGPGPNTNTNPNPTQPQPKPQPKVTSESKMVENGLGHTVSVPVVPR